jgi:hypothetical protein
MPRQEQRQAAVPKKHWCPEIAHQQTFTYLQDIASVCTLHQCVNLSTSCPSCSLQIFQKMLLPVVLILVTQTKTPQHTVADNKASYTWRKIEGADQARDLYRKLEHPSEQAFNKILQNNCFAELPSDIRQRQTGPTDLWPRHSCTKRKDSQTTEQRPPELLTHQKTGSHHHQIPCLPNIHRHFLGHRKPLFTHHITVDQILHSHSDQKPIEEDFTYGGAGSYKPG